MPSRCRNPNCHELLDQDYGVCDWCGYNNYPPKRNANTESQPRRSRRRGSGERRRKRPDHSVVGHNHAANLDRNPFMLAMQPHQQIAHTQSANASPFSFAQQPSNLPTVAGVQQIGQPAEEPEASQVPADKFMAEAINVFRKMALEGPPVPRLSNAQLQESGASQESTNDSMAELFRFLDQMELEKPSMLRLSQNPSQEPSTPRTPPIKPFANASLLLQDTKRPEANQAFGGQSRGGEIFGQSRRDNTPRPPAGQQFSQQHQSKAPLLPVDHIENPLQQPGTSMPQREVISQQTPASITHHQLGPGRVRSAWNNDAANRHATAEPDQEFSVLAPTALPAMSGRLALPPVAVFEDQGVPQMPLQPCSPLNAYVWPRSYQSVTDYDIGYVIPKSFPCRCQVRLPDGSICGKDHLTRFHDNPGIFQSIWFEKRVTKDPDRNFHCQVCHRRNSSNFRFNHDTCDHGKGMFYDLPDNPNHLLSDHEKLFLLPLSNRGHHKRPFCSAYYNPKNTPPANFAPLPPPLTRLERGYYEIGIWSTLKWKEAMVLWVQEQAKNDGVFDQLPPRWQQKPNALPSTQPSPLQLSRYPLSHLQDPPLP